MTSAPEVVLCGDTEVIVVAEAEQKGVTKFAAKTTRLPMTRLSDDLVVMDRFSEHSNSFALCEVSFGDIMLNPVNL